MCYDHLAGRLSVELADFIRRHQLIVPTTKSTEITPRHPFSHRVRVDFLPLRSTRRRLCELCPTGTERRSTKSGAVGIAITTRCSIRLR